MSKRKLLKTGEVSEYFAKTKKVSVQDIEDWKPNNWFEVFNRIRKMRSGNDAPVDSMGCHQCTDTEAPEPVRRFHQLVALMLSSQTKDQVTFAAMQRLREIPGGLTIDNIIQIPDDELVKIIHPVGFKNTKTKHIKATSKILKEKFNSDIPDSIEGLCSLPGVGPKMAHLCMQCAWGVLSGIGVDTHVHRIANRLGWLKKSTKTPEQTRVGLEKWLPKEHWREANHMLVGFGQTLCKPVGPDCKNCLVNDLCPSAKIK